MHRSAASERASAAARTSEASAHLVNVLADLVEHGVRLVAQRIGCLLQYFLQRAHLCVKLLHHEALPLQGEERRRTVGNDVTSMTTRFGPAASGRADLVVHEQQLISQLINGPEL